MKSATRMRLAVVLPNNQGLWYFFSNAPMAMATASLPGLVNYAIILFLSFGGGLEQTGTYRMLFSVFALLGLASLVETNKIMVKAITNHDNTAFTALLCNRCLFSIAAFAAIMAVYFWGPEGWVTKPILIIAVLSAILYPLDSYVPCLQAQKRFGTLLICDLAKYGTALFAFIITLHAGAGLVQAVLNQIAVIAIFHILYGVFYLRRWINWSAMKQRRAKLWTDKGPKEARTYSLAALFPSALEHIDKLLVGWIFGLELLGVYTLAFSTGRFVYNALKPALYIYYGRFVVAMPDVEALKKVASLFTAFGCFCALVFWIAINEIDALNKFQSGQSVTIILFLSYGIAMIRAVYGQAFALNQKSNASHALRASFIGTVLAIPLLVSALAVSPAIALVLLALQYPVRDACTITLMQRYRGKAT